MNPSRTYQCISIGSETWCRSSLNPSRVKLDMYSCRNDGGSVRFFFVVLSVLRLGSFLFTWLWTELRTVYELYLNPALTQFWTRSWPGFGLGSDLVLNRSLTRTLDRTPGFLCRVWWTLNPMWTQFPDPVWLSEVWCLHVQTLSGFSLGFVLHLPRRFWLDPFLPSWTFHTWSLWL